jgi:hypothetical protein
MKKELTRIIDTVASELIGQNRNDVALEVVKLFWQSAELHGFVTNEEATNMIRKFELVIE